MAEAKKNEPAPLSEAAQRLRSRAAEKLREGLETKKGTEDDD